LREIGAPDVDIDLLGLNASGSLRGGQFVGPETHQEHAIAQCRRQELVLHVAGYGRAVMFALEDNPAGTTFNVVAEPRRQRQAF